MKIHKFYKCQKCNEFHSIDYDLYAKSMMRGLARKFEIRKENLPINDLMSFSPADLIRKYSNARNPRRIAGVDRSFDAISSRALSVENRVSSNHPDARQDEMIGRFFFELSWFVCKAIGTNEKTCMTELKNRSGFDQFALDYSAMNHINVNHLSVEGYIYTALQAFHQSMKAFTTDPASQWNEITDLCTEIFVNPSWFSGHRVYEFPVRIDLMGGKKPCTISEARHNMMYGIYECKLITNNLNNSVLKFRNHGQDHSKLQMSAFSFSLIDENFDFWAIRVN